MPRQPETSPSLPETAGARGGAACRELAAAVLVGVLALAAVDLAFRLAAERAALPARIVDIQSAPILDYKLDYLRRHRGRKIVLIGDSLIYGHSLADHGDPDWRRHGLSAQLQERLRQGLPPNAHPLVMNLGMDGSVPGDMECVVRAAADSGADLILFDANIRSFSADFSTPKGELTRPWLRSVASPPGPAVSATTSTAHAAWSGRFDRSLARCAARVWDLYAARDFLQSLAFDAGPRQYLAQARKRLNARLLSQTPGVAAASAAPAGDAWGDDLILLMKAKSRFKTIDFGPENLQRQALERTLRFLAQRRQKAILFYAYEDRVRLRSIIADERYSRLRADLEAVAAPYIGPTLLFLPGAQTIPHERYLDHVHVDREGYRLLLDYLWPEIEKML
jgi:lysophospholipase L1-like esterase